MASSYVIFNLLLKYRDLLPCVTPLAPVPPGVEAEVRSCGWESWLQRGKGSRPLIFVTRHLMTLLESRFRDKYQEGIVPERDGCGVANPGTSYSGDRLPQGPATPGGRLIQGLASGGTQEGGESPRALSC